MSQENERSAIGPIERSGGPKTPGFVPSPHPSPRYGYRVSFSKSDAAFVVNLGQMGSRCGIIWHAKLSRSLIAGLDYRLAFSKSFRCRRNCMCNALHHHANCRCGFGGEGHLGRRIASILDGTSNGHLCGISGGISTWRRISDRSMSHIALELGTSLVAPVTCRYCGMTPIFLFASRYGGFSVFESLGIPWSKHSCANSADEAGFTELISRGEVEMIELPNPNTPEDALIELYAERRGDLEAWARQWSHPIKMRGGPFQRYRFSLVFLTECPEPLRGILKQFLAYGEKAPFEALISLFKASARHLAILPPELGGAGLDSREVGTFVSLWLSEHQLPAEPPREIHIPPDNAMFAYLREKYGI